MAAAKPLAPKRVFCPPSQVRSLAETLESSQAHEVKLSHQLSAARADADGRPSKLTLREMRRQLTDAHAELERMGESLTVALKEGDECRLWQ